MNAELAALRDFLAAHAPFAALPGALLDRAVRALDVAYVRHGQPVLPLGQRSRHLYVVRTGAVELRDEGGALVGRLGEGESFGYPSLLTDAPAARRVATIEDTLLYLLPADAFHDLRRADAAFDRHFAAAHAERVRHAATERPATAGLTTPVARLLTRRPVTAPPELSIRDAARTMCDARVSSLLICEGDALRGIVTDRDLRTRVVAEGADADAPVRTVMTADPVTLDADAVAFEALLTMTQHAVHHLPVLRAGRIAGVVTTTDLMRLEASNPVYLASDVAKAQAVEDLQAASGRLPDLVLRLVEANAKAREVGRAVSAVTDALTRRLIALAEAALGPPPVPYTWLALGSQARQEQTAHSDQDHALVLSDDAESGHEAYFEDLARRVSDGLAACGFVYCPGDVMATNARWRQPLAAWRAQFARWIEAPQPAALMHASIFFDLRPLAGAAALADALHADVLDRCRGHRIFLGSLAKTTEEHVPPLGFFRRFVVERSGEHARQFDLKHRGVVPVVDLARLYALAAGDPAVNTWRRLEAAGEAGTVAPDDAASLADALEVIASVRLRHQAAQVRRGETPDHFVAPDALSPFERDSLRAAFAVVATAQAGIAQRYATGLVAG